MTAAASSWFFTSPLDEVAVRRGDPLGMRGIADALSEELAPGLSNRTVDGRWISILCWILGRAYPAWLEYGTTLDSGALLSRRAARDLYAWVRPLELLWVARTITSGSDAGRGRQVPGVLSLRRWLENPGARRFGFSPNSYELYRFNGVYGAYRNALRSLPGLTVAGGGWQLDTVGSSLAALVDRHATCGATPARKRGRQPVPELYWPQQFSWKKTSAATLPTRLSHAARLPGPERSLLTSALFSADSADHRAQSDARRRREIALAAASSRAQTRHEFFADIVLALGIRPGLRLSALSPFCELADAGVSTINSCWLAVSEGKAAGSGFATLREVAGRQDVQAGLRALQKASRRWKREAARLHPRLGVATALADAVLAAGDQPARQLAALERHHGSYAGGLKWLALDGDLIKPLARIRGGGGSLYRFREFALCRLAVQCGLIKAMPAALVEDEAGAAEEYES